MELNMGLWMSLSIIAVCVLIWWMVKIIMDKNLEITILEGQVRLENKFYSDLDIRHSKKQNECCLYKSRLNALQAWLLECNDEDIKEEILDVMLGIEENGRVHQITKQGDR